MSSQTILVIDGDSKNLQILKESLEGADFQVITANNGNDAWASIQSERIDLIVSEVDIPGIDGFQFLEKLQKDPTGAAIPLVFLTNRRNLEDRIRSLRSGVKDYMIKPLHVKEVIARLQMILRRIERMKTEDTDFARKEVGRLEEQSVEHLIEKFGTERKTGVLTVYDEDSHSGEIYFRDGAVVNARLGNFRAEKAVYQMLPWKQGHFVMMMQDVNVKEEITVSNLGLLLQGFKRLQDREKMIKQLPSLDTIFVKTSLFEKVLQKKKIGGDALKFISLFDGNRKVTDVLTESTYDDIKSLERTLKLYQQGFIQPLGGKPAQRVERDRTHTPQFEMTDRRVQRPAKPEPRVPPPQSQPDTQSTDPHKAPPGFDFPQEEEPADSKRVEQPEPENHIPKPEPEPENEDSKTPPSPKEEERPVSAENHDFDAINGRTHAEPVRQPTENASAAAIVEDLLQRQGRSSGQLAIISSSDEHRKEFVAALTNGRYVTKTLDSDDGPSTEIARLQTASNKKFEIVGISTEKRFVQMLNQLSETLVGYLLLVVADNSTNLDYLGYLINSLKQNFSVPNVVAVYHPPDSKPIPLDVIRYSLNLDDNEQIVDLESFDSESLHDLLKQLQPPAKDQKADTSTLVQSR